MIRRMRRPQLSFGCSLDDFSDPHLDLFAQVAPGTGDSELRARLADVLWVARRPWSITEPPYLAKLGDLAELATSAASRRRGRATRFGRVLGRRNLVVMRA